MTTRHANPTGYDPAEPCRPFSEVAWPADLSLIEPAWRTETVLGVAANIRDTKDFTPLPILADALQDAGCEDAAILNHCRSDGNHDPECWVVVAILRPPAPNPTTAEEPEAPVKRRSFTPLKLPTRMTLGERPNRGCWYLYWLLIIYVVTALLWSEVRTYIKMVFGR